MRENSATNHLDVPLPDGAQADAWEPGRRLSEDETRAWRLIYSRSHTVTDHDAYVRIRAIQYDDGVLDDVEILASGADSDGPLNSDQARELAAALLETAAEVDRWVG